MPWAHHNLVPQIHPQYFGALHGVRRPGGESTLQPTGPRSAAPSSQRGASHQGVIPVPLTKFLPGGNAGSEYYRQRCEGQLCLRNCTGSGRVHPVSLRSAVRVAALQREGNPWETRAVPAKTPRFGSGTAQSGHSSFCRLMSPLSRPWISQTVALSFASRPMGESVVAADPPVTEPLRFSTRRMGCSAV